MHAKNANSILVGSAEMSMTGERGIIAVTANNMEKNITEKFFDVGRRNGRADVKIELLTFINQEDKKGITLEDFIRKIKTE